VRQCRLRIRDVHYAVLNLHISELFAVLVTVSGGPFVVAQVPFSSMARY